MFFYIFEEQNQKTCKLLEILKKYKILLVLS